MITYTHPHIQTHIQTSAATYVIPSLICVSPLKPSAVLHFFPNELGRLQEGLVHAVSCLGRRFHILQSVLVGEGLGFRPLDDTSREKETKGLAKKKKERQGIDYLKD